MEYYQANIKNRIHRTNLNAELIRLEKQKRSEMRMHANEAQRFRAKYSKFSLRSDSLLESSDVRMYETHNPGFCFKRNGDHKIPQTIVVNPVLNYKEMKKLLFTNDDLDVEKFICLHLLSTHKTETLRPPHEKLLRHTSKESMPLERLIQRSKKQNEICEKLTTGLLRKLPIFVLEFSQDQSLTSLDRKTVSEEILIRDGRLASRLIVNEKLSEILEIALKALESSKSDKYKQILNSMSDTNYLKGVFNKPGIQQLLKLLRNYSLITSCDSYYLTPRFKISPVPLEVKTQTGNLESLIVDIRKNVLQFAVNSNNVLKEIHDVPKYVDNNLSQTMIPSIEKSDKCDKIYAGAMSSRSVVSNSSTINSQFDSRSFIRTNFNELQACKFSLTSLLGRQKIQKKSSQIFPIAEYEIRSIDLGVLEDKSKLIDPVSECLKNTKYSTNFTKNLQQATSEGNLTSNTKSIPKTPQVFPIKYSSNISNSYMKDGTYSNTRNRLSALISQEQYNLESYNRRYTSKSASGATKSKRNFLKPPPMILKRLEINPYHLARFQQEIVEKETKKKLEIGRAHV